MEKEIKFLNKESDIVFEISEFEDNICLLIGERNDIDSSYTFVCSPDELDQIMSSLIEIKKRITGEK